MNTVEPLNILKKKIKFPFVLEILPFERGQPLNKRQNGTILYCSQTVLFSEVSLYHCTTTHKFILATNHAVIMQYFPMLGLTSNLIIGERVRHY